MSISCVVHGGFFRSVLGSRRLRRPHDARTTAPNPPESLRWLGSRRSHDGTTPQRKNVKIGKRRTPQNRRRARRKPKNDLKKSTQVIGITRFQVCSGFTTADVFRRRAAVVRRRALFATLPRTNQLSPIDHQQTPIFVRTHETPTMWDRPQTLARLGFAASDAAQKKLDFSGEIGEN